MKNYKIFLLACAIIGISACNKIPDKPVTEELSAKEVAEAAESDSKFTEVYNFIRFRTTFMQKAEAERFQQLSYRRAMKYVHFIDDSAKWNKKRATLEEKWAKENQQYLEKTDEVIENCRKTIEEANLNDYVQIKAVNIEEQPTMFSLSSAYTKAVFTFELNVLKPVDLLTFSYGYISGDNNDRFVFKDSRLLRSLQTGTNFTSGNSISVKKKEFSDLDGFITNRGFTILPETVFSGKDTASIMPNDVPEDVLKCVCIDRKQFPEAYAYHQARAMAQLFPEHANLAGPYVRAKIKDKTWEKDSLAYEFFLIDLE